MTLRQAALDLYKPPFRYEYGYVFDSNNQMVADKGEIGELKGLIATRIRGWGRIQYMDNPAGRANQLQDEVGKIVAEALNEYWGTSLAEELAKLKSDLADFMLAANTEANLATELLKQKKADEQLMRDMLKAMDTAVNSPPHCEIDLSNMQELIALVTVRLNPLIGHL